MDITGRIVLTPRVREDIRNTDLACKYDGQTGGPALSASTGKTPNFEHTTLAFGIGRVLNYPFTQFPNDCTWLVVLFHVLQD